MKKFIMWLMCGCMVAATLTGCGGGTGKGTSGEPAAGGQSAETTQSAESEASGSKVINIWSFTDKVPNMTERRKGLHPDFDYGIKSTIIAATDGAYQPASDQALAAGGRDAPDIYCTEVVFVLKYSQEDASHYVASYGDLGVDMATTTKEADIARYAIDVGTNQDDKIAALGYRTAGGAFIYRRSIAEDVWETDDPKEIIAKVGGGSGSQDRFFGAAEELRAGGYGMIFDDGDLWHAVGNSSDKGWIVDGKLHIDPRREALLDLSKELLDSGYESDTGDWQGVWSVDMEGEGAKPVLGLFGPAWLANYTPAPSCGGTTAGKGTFSDWTVCDSPIGFFWDGTWLLANRDSQVKDAVVGTIKWVILGSSEGGLQYVRVNGTMNETGTKGTVASGTVMSKSDGSVDLLGGQNMFDIFVPANQYVSGTNLTQSDETINTYQRDRVHEYTTRNRSREQVAADFKQAVANNLDIQAEQETGISRREFLPP